MRRLTLKTFRHCSVAALGLVVGLSVGLVSKGYSDEGHKNCTLNPAEGSKEAVLSGGVAGRATWSACTSIVQDFQFEWPRKRGFPANSTEALKRAAALLREWRQTMKSSTVVDGSFNYAGGQSPFVDVVKAIERRAAQAEPYVLGESFAVADDPDWDGAWISLSSTTQATRLAIHYWANP